jgi:hypothetical protein
MITTPYQEEKQDLNSYARPSKKTRPTIPTPDQERKQDLRFLHRIKKEDKA